MRNKFLYKWIYFIINAFIVCKSIYVIFFQSNLNTGDAWKIKICYIFIFWLLGHLFFTLSCYRTFYLLSNAYLIPLLLFHLGITIPDALGIFQDFGWGISFLNHWLELSGWYTILALGCFGVGMSLSFENSEVKQNHIIDVKQNLKSVYIDGIGLLVASAVFFIMAYASYGNLLQYSRVDFFRSGSDSRGFGVFMMVFPSAILVLTITAQEKSEKILSYSLAIFGLMLFMLSGYRSAALFPLIIGCVLWVKTGHKIYLPIALGIIFIVILSIPFIGYLRTVGPYNEIDSKNISKSLEYVEAKETFRTLGQTGGLLAEVLKLVPDKDPYRYGMTYLNAIIDSIPNILPKIATSERTETKKEAFTDPKVIARMVPSNWLTYRIAKEKFDNGEGVGFTGIGEPYLNFGITGVIIFFLILGFLMGRLDYISLLHYPRLILFTCAMMWPLVRTVRNDFSNFIKPAMFMFIIILIWRFGLRIIALKKRPNKLFENKASKNVS